MMPLKLRFKYLIFKYIIMSDANTTSILDLPTDPTGGGSIGGNIVLSANETITSNPNQQMATNTPSQFSLDPNTINQIISGIQQASSSGATQLASRDIPMNTQMATQDPQIQPNYIPDSYKRDYINTEEEAYPEKIIDTDTYYQKNKMNNNLDDLYDEIQIPLLIAVLYFLFQLPIFKKYLYKFFPVLFARDGNINLYGYTFTSIIFGLLYYLLFKIMNYLSKI